MRRRYMTRHIDWDKVDQLFMAGCNIIQTAAALGVHRDTLYKRCEEEKKTTLSAYHEEKRANGDSLILAAQYQKAIKDKHPTMLIWLGKQRLGQKEGFGISKEETLASIKEALANGEITQPENRKVQPPIIEDLET